MTGHTTEAALEAALAQTRADLQAATQRADHLQVALTTNRRIGMAIGILMARGGLTETDAFHCLVQASQQQNRKLATIAEDVIFIGHL